LCEDLLDAQTRLIKVKQDRNEMYTRSKIRWFTLQREKMHNSEKVKTGAS